MFVEQNKCVIAVFICVIINIGHSDFIDISSDVFGDDKHYHLAAFGDFNSDKLTDVFVLEELEENGVKIQVLISQNEPPLLKPLGPSCYYHGLKIVNVVPADFDGDGAMDVLLVTLPNGQSSIYEAFVLWGNLNTLECTHERNEKDFTIQLLGQPLLLDFNGDMIADLFGADVNKTRTVWLFNEGRSHPELVHPFEPPDGGSLHPLNLKSSHGFVDLNGDLEADIWVSSDSHFELWVSNSYSYVLNSSNIFEYPKGVAVIGHASFADLNLDNSIEVLLPACMDTKCYDSRLFIFEFSSGLWIDLKINFKDPSEQTWSWVTKSPYHFSENISLRAGDFNLDGYPDILVTLLSSSGNLTVALLENTESSGSSDFPRTLSPRWGLFDHLHNSVLATFFDFEEDGSLDIIIMHQAQNSLEIAALKNAMEYDAVFVKVLVATGSCYDNCRYKAIPYGTNPAGPSISYSITTPKGSSQRCRATQLSQSAHFALQLPYTVFGLGRNWNFIDSLEVGVPHIHNVSSHCVNTFTQIIPNSQLIVIPYPPDSPQKWINKLFITPSKAMRMTAGALVATCLFVVAIIGILHYRERRQDKKEKLQESQRFHFDAM